MALCVCVLVCSSCVCVNLCLVLGAGRKPHCDATRWPRTRPTPTWNLWHFRLKPIDRWIPSDSIEIRREIDFGLPIPREAKNDPHTDWIFSQLVSTRAMFGFQLPHAKPLGLQPIGATARVGLRKREGTRHVPPSPVCPRWLLFLL